jgi:hypothetical protein
MRAESVRAVGNGIRQMMAERFAGVDALLPTEADQLSGNGRRCRRAPVRTARPIDTNQDVVEDRTLRPISTSKAAFRPKA